jgi:chaperonin GroES
MSIPKPLSDRLIIKPIEEEYTGKIKVFSKVKPIRGQVMAVGDYVSDEIRVGDEVMFNEYAGSEIVVEEIDYLILNEREVIGVVE